ncbi:MAG: hypothetical protein M3203_06690 [Actinomycetota bacterium]|nr:hypothetical protein [Actinomycetota bacterium]
MTWTRHDAAEAAGAHEVRRAPGATEHTAGVLALTGNPSPGFGQASTHVVDAAWPADVGDDS